MVVSQEPMKVPNSQTLANYHLTPESYLQIVREQEGACACCGVSGKNLVIDHNHSIYFEKGRGMHSFRALVCRSCNSRIGQVETRGYGCRDPYYIRVCKYLRKYGGRVRCEGGCENTAPLMRMTPKGRLSGAQICNTGKPFIPYSHR